MKKIVLILFAGSILASKAQVAVSKGSQTAFEFTKDVDAFHTFTIGNTHHFLFKSGSIVDPKYNILMCDASGNASAMELTLDKGLFNNFNTINTIGALNNGLVAITEFHTKEELKNTLTVRTIDKNGQVNKTGTEIGSFPIKKVRDPGNWYVYITPDQQHLAVIAEPPVEKDKPITLKLYFFDANLKKLNEGEFTVTEEYTKKQHHVTLYASDKGDFYLVKEGYVKYDLVPTIYQISAAAPSSITDYSVDFGEGQKLFNYTAMINASGNLVMGGYYMQKKTISNGDEAKGIWIYDSGHPKETKKIVLDKPVEDLTARAIVYNGNTAFLVGEQFKATKEIPTGQAAQAHAFTMEDNYNYRHRDIHVTGFDVDWNKKFNIVMNKDWTARNFDHDLYQSFGVIKGKLAFVYYDSYGKYFPKAHSYSDYKLPVLVNITNEGLMEEPIHLEKQFGVPDYNNEDHLYPRFFVSDPNGLIVLGGRDKAIRGVVFKTQ